MVAPVGVVFWARVSPEVDQRLTEKIATEPVRLQLPEWRSGSIIWIVDAVGEHKVIEAMLTRLLETDWKGQEVRLRARTKDGGYKVGVLGRGPRTASSEN
jgi:hemolysin-activating ACP:hemolysin acyltransferase